MLTAVYIINRTPTSALNGRIPAAVCYDKKQNLSKLRVFGCVAYLHPPKHMLAWKFGSRTITCCMIGYCHNGYRLWYPKEETVIEGRDIVFDESTKYFKREFTNWEDTSQQRSQQTEAVDRHEINEQDGKENLEES